MVSVFNSQIVKAQGGRFVENKGQFHDNVLYRAMVPNGKLFLEYNRLTYLFHNAEDYDQIWTHKKDNIGDSITLRSHAFRVNFKNGNLYPRVEGDKKSETYHNYYIGDDPEYWKSRVPLFDEVKYSNVYKNIDLKFYSHNGYLKYDWIIRKGGDIGNIVMEYEGVDSLRIINDKLYVYTSVTEIVEEIPKCYYKTNEGVLKEYCSFVLNGNQVGFSKEKEIDAELVIDPKLIFSTYSGSYGDNFGFTATYDSKGNLYAGGITDGDDANGGYPVTNGAFQTTYGGGSASPPANLPCDITISKYDSAGTQLLFATYLGGSDSEYPHSLVVNDRDELFVFGTSISPDFPTSVDAYKDTIDDEINGTLDIIVSKFSTDGDKLLASTYVGGNENDGITTSSSLKYNYADDFRGDIIPDEFGCVYIASCTRSTNFPVVNGIQQTKKGGLDGVVFQLSSDLSTLMWSSYLGGSFDDALYSVKLDGNDFVYVGGGTSSPDLPTDTLSIFNKRQGVQDGYLARFNIKTRKLERGTYWGTSEYDQIYFIQLDNRGNLFVTGQTEGTVQPSPNTYSEPGTGQFILKMDTLLTRIDVQTVVGKRAGNPDISPTAFLVDNCDNIYISGWGSDVRDHAGSTFGLPITNGAIQSTTDGQDFYLMVLRKDADSLLYATFFGGDETDDHVDGGTSRFDKKGVVYQSVCSSCPNISGQHFSDFPITTGAAFDTNYSSRCSNAAFKIDLQISSAVIAEFNPYPKIGCSPMTVNVNNTSFGGVKFLWDFGDGTTDTLRDPSHTYTEPGFYKITLTVIDSFACNIFDKTSRTVEVLDFSEAEFDLEYSVCTEKLTFSNSSTNALEYFWDFGDGNTSDKKTPDHNYDDQGTYTITLITNPNTLCADTTSKIIDITQLSGQELQLYNVFTPNDDGMNECFLIDGLEPECDKYELKIYNRWGLLLFKTDDFNECWNGKVDNTGAEVPEGTYFYLLKIEKKEGDKISANGLVNIIR